MLTWHAPSVLFTTWGSQRCRWPARRAMLPGFCRPVLPSMWLPVPSAARVALLVRSRGVGGRGKGHCRPLSAHKGMGGGQGWGWEVGLSNGVDCVFVC